MTCGGKCRTRGRHVGVLSRRRRFWVLFAQTKSTSPAAGRRKLWLRSEHHRDQRVRSRCSTPAPSDAMLPMQKSRRDPAPLRAPNRRARQARRRQARPRAETAAAARTNSGAAQGRTTRHLARARLGARRAPIAPTEQPQPFNEQGPQCGPCCLLISQRETSVSSGNLPRPLFPSLTPLIIPLPQNTCSFLEWLSPS